MTVEANPQPEVKMQFGELIDKLGLSKCFLLCPERLDPEQIELLEYNDWQEIYFNASGYFSDVQAEKETSNLALQKMLEKAENFSQVMRVFTFAKKGTPASLAAKEKLMATGKFEDWLEVVKSESCGIGSKELKQIASEIIRRSIQ